MPDNDLADTTRKKARTISLPPEVDALAVRMAQEAGYYPEKTNGGVSKFLADLVLKASETGVVRDTGSGYMIGLQKMVDERVDHRLEQLKINAEGKVNASRGKK